MDAHDGAAPSLAGERRRCVERAVLQHLKGALVFSSPNSSSADSPLRMVGLPMPHEVSIPFPLGNKRAEYMTIARSSLGGTLQASSCRQGVE